MSLKISKKLTIVLGWFIWLNSWNMVHNISYPLDTKLVSQCLNTTQLGLHSLLYTSHLTQNTKVETLKFSSLVTGAAIQNKIYGCCASPVSS